jgi:DNA-binding SARP family transcriptional activator
LDFRLLGPLEVAAEGVPLALGGRRQQGLLAALLLDADRVVTIDRLAAAVWWEPPRSASSNIRSYVSALRRALHQADKRTDRLLTYPSGYRLATAPGELDLSRFEELVALGETALHAGDARAAVERLGQALALWRGHPLEGIVLGQRLQSQAVSLEERRLAVVERHVEARMALGQHNVAVAELRALVAAHPLRERFWAQLMLALYRLGRQAEALAVYTQVRGHLADELGIDPGFELQRLQGQILRADPALATGAAGGHEVMVLRGHSGPATLPPRQLPRASAAFTGRHDELARLERLLRPPGQGQGPVAIAAITGTPGVGKSALAIHAAHQVADHFADGQLYLDLQGATPGLAPLDPLDALGRMLRSLGLDPGHIPADADEAAARFRSLTAARRLLVVLDNAHDAAQVRLLLPAGPGCAALVTGRQALGTLEGARLLELDLLPHEEAIELLARIAGPERIGAEPRAAAEVVGYCGLLPLAIQIAGTRLADRPTWPVSELASRLADPAGRLDELTVGDLAVRASFEVSLTALQTSPNPVDRQAAAAFGLLTLPNGADLGLETAARLLNRSRLTTQTLLERLVDARMLETPRSHRYRFHDLLRLYAHEQATSRQPSHQRRDNRLARRDR